MYGPDDYIERPSYGENEMQCNASFVEPCEDCWKTKFGVPYAEYYYPKCDLVEPMYAHYTGTTDCESCYPACPYAIQLEVSYNFLKESGLLSLMYDQTLYLENFYQTCVKPVVDDFKNHQKDNAPAGSKIISKAEDEDMN